MLRKYVLLTGYLYKKVAIITLFWNAWRLLSNMAKLGVKIAFKHYFFSGVYVSKTERKAQRPLLCLHRRLLSRWSCTLASTSSPLSILQVFFFYLSTHAHSFNMLTNSISLLLQQHYIFSPFFHFDCLVVIYLTFGYIYLNNA